MRASKWKWRGTISDGESSLHIQRRRAQAELVDMEHSCHRRPHSISMCPPMCGASPPPPMWSSWMAQTSKYPQPQRRRIWPRYSIRNAYTTVYTWHEAHTEYRCTTASCCWFCCLKSKMKTVPNTNLIGEAQQYSVQQIATQRPDNVPHNPTVSNFNWDGCCYCCTCVLKAAGLLCRCQQ
jgi:hypothetical protein